MKGPGESGRSIPALMSNAPPRVFDQEHRMKPQGCGRKRLPANKGDEGVSAQAYPYVLLS